MIVVRPDSCKYLCLIFFRKWPPTIESSSKKSIMRISVLTSIYTLVKGGSATYSVFFGLLHLLFLAFSVVLRGRALLRATFSRFIVRVIGHFDMNR